MSLFGNYLIKINEVYVQWNTITEFLRDSNRYAALSLRTKLNLLGFDLIKGKEVFDIDLYKKEYGMDIAEAKRNEEKNTGKLVDFIDWEEVVVDSKKTLKIKDTARNNIAQLEHLRWNAFHLANGWTKMPKNEITKSVRKDEKRKMHACITGYDELIKLRNKQAGFDEGTDLTLDSEKEKALEKDTIRYDYENMDRLEELLKNSGYGLKKLEETNKE